MALSDEQKELLAGATVAGIAGLAAAGILLNLPKAGEYYLVVSAGSGGTTDSHYPPGRYLLSQGTNVTLTAVPNSGYTVGVWIVDGVTAATGTSSISLTMDTNHNVQVTFWLGGVPPTGTPYALISLGDVTAIQNIGLYATPNGIGITCHVQYCNNNWGTKGTPSYCTTDMLFKVVDAGGNPIPGVSVAFWPEISPDVSHYKGSTVIVTSDTEVYLASAAQPYVAVSDSYGNVTVPLTYLYGLNDSYKQICSDAGMGFTALCGIAPYPFTAYDGETVNLCAVLGYWGECTTGQSGCSGMGVFWPNVIQALVQGTTIQSQAIAYTGFHIKWM
jgi:hypothetical protein